MTRYVGIRKLLIGSKGYRSVVAKDDVLVFLRTVDPVLGSGDIILLPTTQLPCAMQAVLLLQVLHCQHVECPLNPVGRVLYQLIHLVDVGVAGEEMLVEGTAVVEPTQGESAVGSADNLDALVLSFRELTRKTKRLAVRVGDAEVEGSVYEWRRVVTEHERNIIQTIFILSVWSLQMLSVLMDNLRQFVQPFGIGWLGGHTRR